jgi:hypothetical protein
VRVSALAQIRDRSADVRLNAPRRRLVDVRPVFEVVVALRRPGGAAEEVERNGGDAALGQAQRQFLVEPVEAADVRQDHHADVGRHFRRRGEGGEAVAVRRLERQVLVRDGRALDDRDRRRGVELEAHARIVRKAGV